LAVSVRIAGSLPLFPVTVRAIRCLDCGEPIRVEVKDGEIEREEPEGLIGYVSVPIGRWMFNVPYS
jgi:hypothetical protein